MTNSKLTTLKDQLEQKQIELNKYCETSSQDISALKLMLDNAYQTSDFADKDELFQKIVEAQSKMQEIMSEIITTNKKIEHLINKPSPELSYYFVTVLFCVALSLMETYSSIAIALGFVAIAILGMEASQNLQKLD